MTSRFSQPLHRMARGHVNHAPFPSRDLSDPPPACARQSEQSRSIIPSKPTHSTQARQPTSEQAWSGDRDSGPHTHSSRSSRDQNCVRLCCQSSAAPCARALPSSCFYSHDENYVRFALSKSQRQAIVDCASSRRFHVLWPPRRPQWPSGRLKITVQCYWGQREKESAMTSLVERLLAWLCWALVMAAGLAAFACLL